MAIESKDKSDLDSPKFQLHWHYAWVIVAVTFLALLTSAGVRTLGTVFIKPFENEFHWSKSETSLATMVSLFAFGFGGPVGGSLIDRFGPRRVMIGGLAFIASGVGLMLLITDLWQLHLLWGIVVGVGTGAIANVLGATVANRWFNKYRGLIIGLFSAASATGQLIFLPTMIGVTSSSGWRTSFGIVAVVAAVVLLPVIVFMRDSPRSINADPVGGYEAGATAAAPIADTRTTTLREAARTRDFWLLCGSFFICGYTTNGMIGIHLLPHAQEHGFSDATTASALGLMGIMNIFGTLASGWLSDRFDNRKLLAAYYGFRGLSLAALPFILDPNLLYVFAFVYGLDWIATVPPTVNLTAQRFGRASLGKLFGWIFCSHMIGAGIAALAGGFFRDLLGNYHLIFLTAALMGGIAVGLSMGISSPRKLKRMAAQNAA